MQTNYRLLGGVNAGIQKSTWEDCGIREASSCASTEASKSHENLKKNQSGLCALGEGDNNKFFIDHLLKKNGEQEKEGEEMEEGQG